MNILPLVFIAAEVFAATFYRRVYYYLNIIMNLGKERRGKNVQVIVINTLAIFIIIYFLLHLAYLLYAMYLMFTPTWEPGCLLLIFSALQSCSVRWRIDGTYEIDRKTGYVYPTFISQLFFSGMNIYILLHLV